MLVSVDVSCCPALLIHGKERLHIGVSAVWQGGNEYVCRDNLARICVNDRCGVACPVHLKDLSGFVIQVHGGVCLCRVIPIILFELCQLVRNLSVCLARLTVLHPQEIQRDAAFLHFLMDVLVIRHFVASRLRCRREQNLSKLFVRHLFRQGV